jgi:hypothetical protein
MTAPHSLLTGAEINIPPPAWEIRPTRSSEKLRDVTEEMRRLYSNHPDLMADFGILRHELNASNGQLNDAIHTLAGAGVLEIIADEAIIHPGQAGAWGVLKLRVLAVWPSGDSTPRDYEDVVKLLGFEKSGTWQSTGVSAAMRALVRLGMLAVAPDGRTLTPR